VSIIVTKTPEQNSKGANHHFLEQRCTGGQVPVGNIKHIIQKLGELYQEVCACSFTFACAALSKAHLELCLLLHCLKLHKGICCT